MRFFFCPSIMWVFKTSYTQVVLKGSKGKCHQPWFLWRFKLLLKREGKCKIIRGNNGKMHEQITWLDKKLWNMLSKSADITTNPLIAFWSSTNVNRMTFNNLLNLSHSCNAQFFCVMSSKKWFSNSDLKNIDKYCHFWLKN